MQPSTQRTGPGASIGRLPAGLFAVVVVAGSASVFATYWDDAWHTDLGRDQATIPPHLLLYGSMAVIGAVVAAWACRRCDAAVLWPRSGGSLRCCWPPRVGR
jgi:predicted MFS family arabinose efflux permease